MPSSVKVGNRAWIFPFPYSPSNVTPIPPIASHSFEAVTTRRSLFILNLSSHFDSSSLKIAAAALPTASPSISPECPPLAADISNVNPAFVTFLIVRLDGSDGGCPRQLHSPVNPSAEAAEEAVRLFRSAIRFWYASFKHAA